MSHQFFNSIINPALFNLSVIGLFSWPLGLKSFEAKIKKTRLRRIGSGSKEYRLNFKSKFYIRNTYQLPDVLKYEVRFVIRLKLKPKVLRPEASKTQDYWIDPTVKTED